MSYAQFGYSYPTSSQFLMTGQHSTSSCCEPGQAGVTGEPQVGQAPTAAAVCSLPAAYDSRLLSTYPRLTTGLTVSGLYGSSYPDQTSYMAALGTNPSAFYSSLSNPYDLKDNGGTWGSLPQAAACYPYDPTLAAYGPYGDRYAAVDSAARRKNATRETTNTLKAWLYEHRKNPYPTKGEKIMLAIITKMTLTQVSTWFANARRRLKKENKMTWEPRNKNNENCDSDGDKDSIAGDDTSAAHRKDEDKVDDRDCKRVDRVEDVIKNNSGLTQGANTVKLISEDSDSGHEDSNASSLTSSSPLNNCCDSSSSGPPLHPYAHPTHNLLSNPLLLRDSQNVNHVRHHMVADNNSPSCRPKIWSLAHTATSDSPPLGRRSPTSAMSPSVQTHLTDNKVSDVSSQKVHSSSHPIAQNHLDGTFRVPTVEPVYGSTAPSNSPFLSRTWANGTHLTSPLKFENECQSGVAPCKSTLNCSDQSTSPLNPPPPSVGRTNLSFVPDVPNTMPSPQSSYTTRPTNLMDKCVVSAGSFGNDMSGNRYTSSASGCAVASSQNSCSRQPPLIRVPPEYPSEGVTGMSNCMSRTSVSQLRSTDRLDGASMNETKPFLDHGMPKPLIGMRSGPNVTSSAFKPMAKSETATV